MDLWSLLKDILLTGTGVAVIVSQVLSAHPSDVLLVTGLALTVPSLATHATAVLGGHVSSSSRSSDAPTSEPSQQSSSAGGTGED